MRPVPLLLLAAFFLAAACAGDPALTRRYESLQKERKVIQQDMARAAGEADRLFSEATAAERQAGRSVAGAARCTAPRGGHRAAAPLSFGPVRLRYQTHSYFFTESAPFETTALQCVQAQVTAR